MNSRPLTHFLALLLIPVSSLRADFRSGQAADLALGEIGSNRTFKSVSAIAVDPVTHKVFVSDAQRSRVLRFSSPESLTNGGGAEAVLGQADFVETGPGTATNRLSYPQGLAVDSAGRLWVADQGNNRVLRFDHAASLGSGAPAAGLLGQPGFSSKTPGVAENRMDSPAALAADQQGALWVVDTGNHRVLRMDNAAAKPIGGAADGVLGQPDFSQNNPSISADGLTWPSAIAVESVLASGIWTTSRLWVGDGVRNRVLLFTNPASKPDGGAADLVLGQPTFTDSAFATTRNGMNGVSGLAVAGGTLWVADRDNHRVLRFDNAAGKTNGANADGVLGQSVFTAAVTGGGVGGMNGPLDIALDGGRLWIADDRNRRVLRHENAALKSNGNDADGLLGAAVFIAAGIDARTVSSGGGMAIDPVSGKVFVSDQINNRVLRFASAGTLSSGAAAEAVLGQPDFTSNAEGLGASGMRRPAGLAMDHSGHLWVADSSNSRVLRFDNAATLPTGSAASRVLGQATFQTWSWSATASTMYQPTALAVETTFNQLFPGWSTTRLWVADSRNSRVLRFDNPVSLANGAAASGVLGQMNFTSSAGTSDAGTISDPSGLATDAAGHLWVSDRLFHRVLRFDAAAGKANGASANGLLLQPSFTLKSYSPITSQTLGSRPYGLCASPAGRLFVSNLSSNRVVWFDNAATRPNGAAADGVLGQPGFGAAPDGFESTAWNSLDGCADCALDASGRLWVSDLGHERVLRFSPALESSIKSVGLDVQGKFYMLINARIGERFEVRSSPDLQNWSVLEASIKHTSGAAGSSFTPSFWIAPAAAAGQRFYRLEWPHASAP